jgi:hypothetical protein
LLLLLLVNQVDRSLGSGTQKALAGLQLSTQWYWIGLTQRDGSIYAIIERKIDIFKLWRF